MVWEPYWRTALSNPSSRPRIAQYGLLGPLHAGRWDRHYPVSRCTPADQCRIPERVVHAKGSGAHGVWECTDDLSDLCCADMFKKGTKCPITTRFSTVGRESGSPDLARSVISPSPMCRTSAETMLIQ